MITGTINPSAIIQNSSYVLPTQYDKPVQVCLFPEGSSIRNRKAESFIRVNSGLDGKDTRSSGYGMELRITPQLQKLFLRAHLALSQVEIEGCCQWEAAYRRINFQYCLQEEKGQTHHKGFSPLSPEI